MTARTTRQIRHPLFSDDQATRDCIACAQRPRTAHCLWTDPYVYV